MALEFTAHSAENTDDYDMVLISGDCPSCNKPSSLIQMDIKFISSVKAKIAMKCFCCNQDFSFISKKGG
jgi:hypothetical protein